jgi:tetratricopeptide (TPR) repeat protein
MADVDHKLDTEIEDGRVLKRSGDEEGAIRHFEALAARYPDHPLVQAELAYAYDFAGREAQAVAPYRRAIELGLPEDLLPGHLLGLGSTLRNVEQIEESARVLRQAVERFPDRADLKVFLALSLHSAGEQTAALVTLLDLILASPGVDLHGYERAARYYTDELAGRPDPEEA